MTIYAQVSLTRQPVFLYFFVLTVFTVMHQKDDCKVWHTSVRDFPWFATKASLGSAPNTPVGTKFVGKKPPSFAVPKPRRPPPIFVQQRAGLSSQYEIEHFPDPGSLEAPPVAQVPLAPHVSTKPTALSLYPQYVQSTILKNDPQQTVTSQVPAYQQSSTYYSSNPGSSPPPIKNWPPPNAQHCDFERSTDPRAFVARTALARDAVLSRS